MSHKQGQDNHVSYMDGVRVKISEKYKPPPRINLAMSYSQRLLLNKQIQDAIPRYDFTLETSIKEKMKEWRTARNLTALDNKKKLDIVKKQRQLQIEERTKQEEKREIELKNQKENELSDKVNEVTNLDSSKLQNYTSGGVLIPTQVNCNNYTNILTPIPLTKQTNFKPIDQSPINISDFEPDSSPFDNMELKTINDMEELKLVLQNDDKNIQSKATHPNYTASNMQTYDKYHNRDQQINYYGYNLAHSSNQSYPVNSLYTTNTNGYNYYDTLHTNINSGYNAYDYNNTSKTEYSDAQSTDNKLPFRSVADIMKALQSELNHTHLDNKNSLPSQAATTFINKVETSHTNTLIYSNKINQVDNLENPFDYLPKKLQDVCNVICLMGFPLPRVARACKTIGDDQKKIVEHLLVMAQLLDLGFPEKEVSSALFQCNNDRDKALELLIS